MMGQQQSPRPQRSSCRSHAMDGTLRYRLAVGDGERLTAAGHYGYVCSSKAEVLRVLDARDGTPAAGPLGT